MPVIINSDGRSWHLLGISRESGTVLRALPAISCWVFVIVSSIPEEETASEPGVVTCPRSQSWQAAVRTLTWIWTCWSHALSARASLAVPQLFSLAPSLLSSGSQRPKVGRKGLGVV